MTLSCARPGPSIHWMLRTASHNGFFSQSSLVRVQLIGTPCRAPSVCLTSLNPHGVFLGSILDPSHAP